MHRLTRRELLRRSAGTAALAAGVVAAGGGVAALSTVLRPGVAAAAVPPPFTRPLPLPPVLTDDTITLVAAASDVPILDGAPTRMWTFNGTFPGPTIRRPVGSTTTVTVVHQLPPPPPGLAIGEEDSLAVHHHGGHSASEHDGLPLPEHAIQPGGSRTYVYDHVEDGAPERAALQWYHDHTHFRTSFHAYMGLAGFFILDDELEDATYRLPRGAYELPLFLTDRIFDEATNQLDVSRFGTTATSREFQGPAFFSMVNGALQPFVDVEPRRYRLRVHCGAAFALYNLKLARTDSDDPRVAAAASTPAVPLLQVGTESGLLPQSVERQQVLLGPAERADLIVDFSAYAGQKLVLASVDPRDKTRSVLGLPAQTPPTLNGDSVVNRVFLQFRVGTASTEPDAGPVPPTLRPLPEWVAELPSEPSRSFVFGRGVNPSAPAELPHTINGRPFDDARVDATPELGSVESWLLLNAGTQTHYIHLHDVDWYVVSRNGSVPPPYEAGLKETFKLDPGESIVVGTKFTDHLGPYMLHCHMLDHEDSGMMARWDVVEPGAGRPTTMTDEAQRATDAILAAIRRNPGQPAPADVLAALQPAAAAATGSAPAAALSSHHA